MAIASQAMEIRLRGLQAMVKEFSTQTEVCPVQISGFQRNVLSRNVSGYFDFDGGALLDSLGPLRPPPERLAGRTWGTSELLETTIANSSTVAQGSAVPRFPEQSTSGVSGSIASEQAESVSPHSKRPKLEVGQGNSQVDQENRNRDQTYHGH